MGEAPSLKALDILLVLHAKSTIGLRISAKDHQTTQDRGVAEGLDCLEESAMARLGGFRQTVTVAMELTLLELWQNALGLGCATGLAEILGVVATDLRTILTGVSTNINHSLLRLLGGDLGHLGVDMFFYSIFR